MSARDLDEHANAVAHSGTGFQSHSDSDSDTRVHSRDVLYHHPHQQLNASKLIMRHAPVTGENACQAQKDYRYDEAGHQGYG